MDARDLYDRMLREQIVPRLRDLGFRGSKPSFYLPNPGGHHAGIGFQRYRFNSPASCRFTINVSFHAAELWRAAKDSLPSLPTRPHPNHRYLLDRQGVRGPTGVWQSGWEKRIGFLMDAPHDHWWTVMGPDDVLPVVEHVSDVIAKRLMPQFTGRIAGDQPTPLPPPSSKQGQKCPWPHCHPLGDDV